MHGAGLRPGIIFFGPSLQTMLVRSEARAPVLDHHKVRHSLRVFRPLRLELKKAPFGAFFVG